MLRVYIKTIIISQMFDVQVVRLVLLLVVRIGDIYSALESVHPVEVENRWRHVVVVGIQIGA